jgi:hypothetical protein
MRQRQGEITWPRTQLYKPFADDHGGGPQTKDNRAMAILPPQGSSVTVYDSRGNKIDIMRRFSPDHTGTPRGARYYSRLYAYELGNLAERNTGSRLIRIGHSPLTDADFRSGYK